MKLSVLTLNKNRSEHLSQLIKGLEKSRTPPDELIIVEMSATFKNFTSSYFPIKIFHLPSEVLALSKARNLAAAKASYEQLAFLDVDCIPSHNFIDCLKSSLEKYSAIISPKVLYLPDVNIDKDWQEENLKKIGKENNARQFPTIGFKEEKNPGLFWSLAFGLTKKTFQKIGGFHEDYDGYGAEDTDFGFMAKSLGIKNLLTSETCVYHQYHKSFDPPYQHFSDIIKNAKIFYSRWKKWPMEGWLQAFKEEKLITWQEDKIQILKYPSLQE